jgi:hypothetical protein
LNCQSRTLGQNWQVLTLHENAKSCWSF